MIEGKSSRFGEHKTVANCLGISEDLAQQFSNGFCSGISKYSPDLSSDQNWMLQLGIYCRESIDNNRNL